MMDDELKLRLRQANGQRRDERRDAAENRALLLATAERLFAEKGVAAVKMAEIAATAGVGKGTLYRRFSNKGELCLGLMDTRLRAFQDVQLAKMRELTAAGASYLEQLAHFLEALVTFTAEHMPLLCEVQQYSQSMDEGEVERPHYWQYMTVHGLLQRAVRAGEMRPEVDVAYTAEALLAPLNAQTFRFQLEQLAFTPARIQAGLRGLVAALGTVNIESAKVSRNESSVLPAKS